MDPIKGMNESCARDLYVNSLTEEIINKDRHLPKFIEANCAGQKTTKTVDPLSYTIHMENVRFHKA